MVEVVLQEEQEAAVELEVAQEVADLVVAEVKVLKEAQLEEQEAQVVELQLFWLIRSLSQMDLAYLLMESMVPVGQTIQVLQ